MANQPPSISDLPRHLEYCHRQGDHYTLVADGDIDICGICERAWLGLEVVDGY